MAYESSDEAHRQGVCLGLSELMAAAGRESVSNFLPKLIPAVRSGLCCKCRRTNRIGVHNAASISHGRHVIDVHAQP